MCASIGGTGPGSFVCSFRFALAILCFFVTMNLYAQRIGMSVAIVCMVNHTELAMMRDADQSSSSSSNEGNLTMTAPSEWQTNESDDATKQQSPCVGNLIAGINSSGAMVIADWLLLLLLDVYLL